MVIGRTPGSEIRCGNAGLDREIILHPEDAMQIMKAIFYYAGSKDLLEKLVLREPAEDYPELR
ncbi:MAG: hypothetical protein ACE5DM_04220 [Candidatus Nanoarchaeia archaeon]